MLLSESRQERWHNGHKKKKTQSLVKTVNIHFKSLHEKVCGSNAQIVCQTRVKILRFMQKCAKIRENDVSIYSHVRAAAFHFYATKCYSSFNPSHITPMERGFPKEIYCNTEQRW